MLVINRTNKLNWLIGLATLKLSGYLFYVEFQKTHESNWPCLFTKCNKGKSIQLPTTTNSLLSKISAGEITGSSHGISSL